MIVEDLIFNCPSCDLKIITPSKNSGVTSPCPKCDYQVKAPDLNNISESSMQNNEVTFLCNHCTTKIISPISELNNKDNKCPECLRYLNPLNDLENNNTFYNNPGISSPQLNETTQENKDIFNQSEEENSYFLNNYQNNSVKSYDEFIKSEKRVNLHNLEEENNNFDINNNADKSAYQGPNNNYRNYPNNLNNQDVSHQDYNNSSLNNHSYQNNNKLNQNFNNGEFYDPNINNNYQEQDNYDQNQNQDHNQIDYQQNEFVGNNQQQIIVKNQSFKNNISNNSNNNNGKIPSNKPVPKQNVLPAKRTSLPPKPKKSHTLKPSKTKKSFVNKEKDPFNKNTKLNKNPMISYSSNQGANLQSNNFKQDMYSQKEVSKTSFNSILFAVAVIVFFIVVIFFLKSFLKNMDSYSNKSSTELHYAKYNDNKFIKDGLMTSQLGINNSFVSAYKKNKNFSNKSNSSSKVDNGSLLTSVKKKNLQI